jgi:hypothetical protein
MEARVLVDKDGQVITAAVGVRMPTEVAGGPPVPNMGPIAQEGQEVIELGLPEEFERQPLTAALDQLADAVKGRMKSAK